MSESPIERLLSAFDSLELDRVMALWAPDGELLIADGRRASGTEEVRRLLESFAAGLRSSSHRILAQWHQEDAWVAEVESSYELRDWLRLEGLPRAFVAREADDGIRSLHVYGAHEHPITEHRTGEEGMWLGDRWIPPL